MKLLVTIKSFVENIRLKVILFTFLFNQHKMFTPSWLTDPGSLVSAESQCIPWMMYLIFAMARHPWCCPLFIKVEAGGQNEGDVRHGCLVTVWDDPWWTSSSRFHGHLDVSLRYHDVNMWQSFEGEEARCLPWHLYSFNTTAAVSFLCWRSLQILSVIPETYFRHIKSCFEFAHF